MTKCMNRETALNIDYMWSRGWWYTHVCMWVYAQSVVSDCLWPYASIAHQAPLSMGSSRQGYWIGLPFPPPGDLTTTRIERALPCVCCIGRWIFTTEPPGKPYIYIHIHTHTHTHTHIQSDEKGKIIKRKEQ